VRLLLDTNVFLDAAFRPDRLRSSRAQLEDHRNVLLLSAATSWEIAIKSGTGRLSLPDPARSWVPRHARALGCTLLDITHDVAVAVAELPLHHRDPFDRLLIAQALALRVPIVTSDPAFAAYGVEVIAAG